MNTNNTLFTKLLIESIMEENNINEGKVKDFLKRNVGPYVAGLATAAAINNPEIIKKPFSILDKIKTSQSAKSFTADYVTDQDELLTRQAYAESRFNPKVMSPAGARGLAQIMPSALEDYLKRNPDEEINLDNPQHSAKVQISTMKKLYNADFIKKGDPSEVVRLAKTFAAYNWGRGNLSTYLNKAKNEGIDIYNSLDWTQNLPKETKDYINKILLKKDTSFETEYKKAISSNKFKKITNYYNNKNFK